MEFARGENQLAVNNEQRAVKFDRSLFTFFQTQGQATFAAVYLEDMG